MTESLRAAVNSRRRDIAIGEIEMQAKHSTGRPPKPAIERFLAKVIILDDDCWIWQGSLYKGYGRFRPDPKRKSIKAHKAAYILFRGPWPDGKEGCHQCHRTCCVNPFHIEPGTRLENEQQKTAAGRRPKQTRFGIAHPCYYCRLPAMRCPSCTRPICDICMPRHRQRGSVPGHNPRSLA